MEYVLNSPASFTFYNYPIILNIMLKIRNLKQELQYIFVPPRYNELLTFDHGDREFSVKSVPVSTIQVLKFTVMFICERKLNDQRNKVNQCYQ